MTKHIDTYLFDDLETIHEIKKLKGNEAYLYIFAICSGMEFLGALLQTDSPIKEARVDTSNSLARYIKNYLIPVVDDQYINGYRLFQKIAPALVRNGLAHNYAPKGPIAVGRYKHLYTHLAIQRINGENQLFINADVLYQDFRKSYETIVKPLIQPSGRLYEQAKQHYEEIRTVYRLEVSTLLNL